MPKTKTSVQLVEYEYRLDGEVVVSYEYRLDGEVVVSYDRLTEADVREIVANRKAMAAADTQKE